MFCQKNDFYEARKKIGQGYIKKNKKDNEVVLFMPTILIWLMNAFAINNVSMLFTESRLFFSLSSGLALKNAFDAFSHYVKVWNSGSF